MTQDKAIVIIDPQRAIAEAKNRRSIVMTLTKTNVLRKDVDYGKVPGTDKPTLFKPGAERLCSAFGLNPQFETIEKIERWEPENPLFFYRIACHLIHIDSGVEVATGIGSCNSMEIKYRWRWVNEADVPAHLDKSVLLSKTSTISEFDFAVEKSETTGQYGKPVSYWQQFKDAIANGTARPISKKTRSGNAMKAWEIGGAVYRIPNDDIFSLVNTIDKMACKRALVAAALIGANASEFFTQDIEDMPGFGVSADGDVVNGTFTEIELDEEVKPHQTTNGHEPDSVPAAAPSAKVVGVQPRPTQPPASVAEPPAPSAASDDPLVTFGIENGASNVITQDPREQEADDDPRRINCDILVVSRTKEGKVYALAIANKRGKRIAPVPVEKLHGLTVGDTPVEQLDPGNHDLIPNWRVYAEFNDGWHIAKIVTGMPLEGVTE